MHPALIYRPGDKLALAELCSARLDGHLVEIDEAYMPADTVEGTTARALAVSAFVPEGTAAMGPTAAWIHGAGDAPPLTHHIQRALSRRIRVTMMPRREYHEIHLPGTDSMRIAQLTLTTPVRTLVDLARMSQARADFLPWLGDLVAILPAESAGEAHDRLRAQGSLPGKRHGLRLLAELAATTATSR